MGAWIEIKSFSIVALQAKVAPFMGAWIEIDKKGIWEQQADSRTLYGCVD